MIELKLATVNKAVLLATSRYFCELATAFPSQDDQSVRMYVQNSPTYAVVDDNHDELAAPVSSALRLPLAPANVDDEDDDPIADLPVPPTSGAGSFAAAGIELDSDGFPWDHRIHASTKTKIGNGTWKLKPRTEPALIEQVRAEYKQVAAVPSTMTPPMLPQAAAVEPVPTQPAPQAAAAPVIAPPATAGEKPTNPGMLFAATMKLYAEVEKAGKLQSGAGDVWAKAAGLPSLSSLIARPDLCGAFYDQLQGMIA